MKVERSSNLSGTSPTIGAVLDASDALVTFVTRDDVQKVKWPDYQARNFLDKPVWRSAIIVRDNLKPIACRQGDTSSGDHCSSSFVNWKSFAWHVKSIHPDKPPYPWTRKNMKPEDPAYAIVGPVPEKKVRCEYCGLKVLSRSFNVSVRQCKLYTLKCCHLLVSDALGRWE
jgi:hypothetical protein